MEDEHSTLNHGREGTYFEFARARGQVLAVQASIYKGNEYIDVRVHYRPDGPGTPLKPTGKGVTIPYDLADEIADAIKYIALEAFSDDGR
jgi:hypothetical protein